ncbi:MAG: preprotein translocase subunit YajC [Gaiellaceae bacterium]
MSFLIILLFGFAVMWLLIVLPQRRRQRAHEELVGKLRPGDYVLTAGGLYGTVLEVGDDDLGLEVSPDIEVRVAKRAVTTLVPPDQIEDVEIDDEPEPIQGERG